MSPIRFLGALSALGSFLLTVIICEQEEARQNGARRVKQDTRINGWR